LSGISSAPSRRGLLSGLAVTGAVCFVSQRPAKSVCFGSRGRGCMPTWNDVVEVDVSTLQISRYLQNVRNMEMLCDLSRPIAYSTVKGIDLLRTTAAWCTQHA